jgi:sugar lactone lactonase YvrE
MSVVPEAVWQVGALLGEGPAWIAEEAALFFVDIKGGCLHRYDPATGGCRTLEIGGNPSFVLPRAGGGLIVGSHHAIHPIIGDALGAAIATIAQPTHNRTNDATVDARGRLWVSTMDDEETVSTGTMWCMEEGVLRHAGTNAVVTNGPAISADGRYLYHVDSADRRITRYRIEENCSLAEPEPFVTLQRHEGHPDGVVLDAEGCLWVGLWDGWGVRRYAPDGSLLLHVALPCARVTKVALGGPDLRTAYVTTARIGLDDAALAEQPLAGSLFAFEAPAPGLPLPLIQV